ncbi:hypothetical protein U1Q18_011293 [Sarracenia purpurea var. burkii]
MVMTVVLWRAQNGARKVPKESPIFGSGKPRWIEGYEDEDEAVKAPVEVDRVPMPTLKQDSTPNINLGQVIDDNISSEDANVEKDVENMRDRKINGGPTFGHHVTNCKYTLASTSQQKGGQDSRSVCPDLEWVEWIKWSVLVIKTCRQPKTKEQRIRPKGRGKGVNVFSGERTRDRTQPNTIVCEVEQGFADNTRTSKQGARMDQGNRSSPVVHASFESAKCSQDAAKSWPILGKVGVVQALSYPKGGVRTVVQKNTRNDGAKGSLWALRLRFLVGFWMSPQVLRS